jgi:DNA-binding beta-propeller fold protein YncE
LVGSGYVAVDASYNMYVVGQVPGDAGHVGLLKVSPSGTVLAHWGRIPAEADPSIAGVALSRQGNIYLGDATRSRVVELSPSFHFIREWGSFGPRPGQFAPIEGLAIDSQDHVYVGDCVPRGSVGSPENNRVEEFTSSGRVLRVITGQPGGRLLDRFNCVDGIAVDQHDTMYAVDRRDLRLLVFTNGHTWRSTIPLLYHFEDPEGLAVDPTRSVAYVAFPTVNTILEYELPSGKVLARWQIGPWRVFSLAVDPYGDVYADEGQVDTPGKANRLVRFSPTGEVAASWTSS